MTLEVAAIMEDHTTTALLVMDTVVAEVQAKEIGTTIAAQEVLVTVETGANGQTILMVMVEIIGAMTMDLGTTTRAGVTVAIVSKAVGPTIVLVEGISNKVSMVALNEEAARTSQTDQHHITKVRIFLLAIKVIHFNCF